MRQPAWNELPARHKSLRDGPIRLIVLHDTCGAGTHNDTLYLAGEQDDGREVSVDFTVEKDGSIWKLNPDLAKFCTWHAGRHTAWQGLRNSGVNHASIGIEIVQKAAHAEYTDRQVAAVAALCAWLCGVFSLPRTAITTHASIITDGSRDDPRNFPFEGPGGFWHLFETAGGAEAPAAPAGPPKTQTVRGKMSTFGGPEDRGVAPAEGLALRWGHDVDDPRLGAVFLPTQPPGTSGLARRLNPEARYIAMRWDYSVTSKVYLRTIMVRVLDPETRMGLDAFPVDWGPNEDTERIADLSPGLARALGFDTDDECEVIIPLP